MNTDFLSAVESIEKEKGISRETLFEAIELALISAYKRNFNSSQNVRVDIDRLTGEIRVFSQLTVVEEVETPQQEITLAEARIYDPHCQLDSSVEVEVTPTEFGRIAAQTAKQVVIQRIREAERELIYDEFLDRKDDIINGLVQRFDQRNVIIDLGRAEAILPVEEQIRLEKYRQGERIKTYIADVKKTTKGPQIIVSRSHPGLLKRLFELEVPEIFDGIVEIKALAREAGFRSKIAVWSNNQDVDPVGACVGSRGSRVKAISNELKGEKIDIIKWNEEPEIFISNALSPAAVVNVELNSEQKVATVIVPDDQLSLAIGKEGQNARLAAKVSGWKIDISSETQIAQQRLSSLGLSPEEEEGDPDLGKIRKLPLRICVGCQERKPKRELIRIVRSPDGEVAVDPTGKKSGRGAYICPRIACLQKAIKGKRLEKNLQVPITPAVIDALHKMLALEENPEDQIK